MNRTPNPSIRPPAREDEHRMARKLGRLVALAMAMFGALVIAIGTTGCTDDDDDGPSPDWTITGTWENEYAEDEIMVFYSTGSGYWQSTSTGSYLDFSYTCAGDYIYFTMMPAGAPAYNLTCTINVYDDDEMSITWPASSMYGPTTIYYERE